MLASSIGSIFWLLCGLVAVFSMLRLLGGKPGETPRKKLLWSHRLLGGIFSVIYLVFALAMIHKYQANSPRLLPNIAVHAFLAMALFPLLLAKHYIVRFAKRYYPALPYIGLTVFVMAFVIASTTGINHILLLAKGPKIMVESINGPRQASAAVGRDLLSMKCARCHDLIFIYRSTKNEQGWRNTVERMVRHDPGLDLEADQIDHIIGYLIQPR
jgi:hypothetical protein